MQECMLRTNALLESRRTGNKRMTECPFKENAKLWEPAPAWEKSSCSFTYAVIDLWEQQAHASRLMQKVDAAVDRHSLAVDQ